MSDSTAPQILWGQDLAALAQPAADWLWHGFVSRGNITLLTSQWKAGKTTLLSLLLARRKQGGNLAGLAIQPGKSVVVSEEAPALWADRARRYGFGDHVCVIPKPFRAFPTPDQWQGLMDTILELHRDHGLDLAVIDPLAPFCPSENQARAVLETLLPLSALTGQNMAVLVMHHPGKGEKQIGHAARGSGALLGHVDISIEMRHPAGDPMTRRRRFLALSRHAETPRNLLLELNPDATDYLAVPDAQDDDFDVNWHFLRMVLEDAPHKLTRSDILVEWPPDFNQPSRSTLWRWLDRAVALGAVAREGTGRKADPFVFWLPQCEEEWKRDPLYKFREEQRRLFAIPPHKLTPEELERRVQLLR